MALCAAASVIAAAGIAAGLGLFSGSDGSDELATTSLSASPTLPIASSAVSQTPLRSGPAAAIAATGGHPAYTLATLDDTGAVRFPATMFDDDAARYFTYMHNDKPIEFFIVRSTDGIIRAAFNACDVCFGAKRGYSQDGQVMICNNCNRQFPADQINVVQGGCNPAPLNRSMEGDDLVIAAADLISGERFF